LVKLADSYTVVGDVRGEGLLPGVFQREHAGLLLRTFEDVLASCGSCS